MIVLATGLGALQSFRHLDRGWSSPHPPTPLSIFLESQNHQRFNFFLVFFNFLFSIQYGPGPTHQLPIFFLDVWNFLNFATSLIKGCINLQTSMAATWCIKISIIIHQVARTSRSVICHHWRRVRHNASLRSQKAVSAYWKSKQLLYFEWQNGECAFYKAYNSQQTRGFDPMLG